MQQNVSFENFDLVARKIYLDTEKRFISMTLGEGSYIVSASLEYGSTKCHVMVGKYCSIAHGVKFIIALNHDTGAVSTYPFDVVYKQNTQKEHKFKGGRKQVIIGNDVWIGAYTTILGGVRIGNGAVIGAGAVVAKDVPPYAIVVGNPARIIRYRFDKDTIDWLQQLRWWNWKPEQVLQRQCYFSDILTFRENFPAEVQNFTVSKACDELSKALEQSRQEGYIFYYFLPDILSKEAIWKEVFEKFKEGDSSGSKKILFVDMPQALPSPIKSQLIRLVGTYKSGQILLNNAVDGYDVRVILPFMDFIILTKEAEMVSIIDFASSYKCELLYGFDDF